MKRDGVTLDEVLDQIPEVFARNQYTEVAEDVLIERLSARYGGRTNAAEAWEVASAQLRQPIVRRERVCEWNLFRRVLCITRLPSADEIARMEELYALTTPHEIDRRIRALSGAQFEHFLGELLRRMPGFKEVVVTQLSRDGGVDLRGKYVPDGRGPEWALIGQAKQVASPVAVEEARSFIGALDTCGQARVYGLFVSTGGFTDPAHQVLMRSRFPMAIWGLEEVRERVFECQLGLRRVEVSFEMPDETFWDEVFGGA
jgi:restriction endonuclease Mrr